MSTLFSKSFLFLAVVCYPLVSVLANQTDTLSPVLPEDVLPFSISIQEAGFALPSGIHSGAFAEHQGKWIFLAGRTNGLHGFGPGPANFPPSQQNTTVYVINPDTQEVFSRELTTTSSGLTPAQIDHLSVTSPQCFHNQETIYISGGYGVDTLTGLFSTKPVLTAIDLKGLVKWVTSPNSTNNLAKHVRQTTDPLLQVTGGYMTADAHLTAMLVFGQNFQGFYSTSSNGNYTQQVRCFQIIDTGSDLYVQPRKSQSPSPDYRRRDLNVVPIIKDKKLAYVALAGVFTLDTGVWTVPVFINADGTSSMADPANPATFKQAMNHYVSATAGVYSRSTRDMYIILLGGISYGYFQGGVFQTDAEIPFINQVTTIRIDKNNNFSQYLMNNEYPVIPSTGSNPGNPLLFGAGAKFIPARNMASYNNHIFQLDKMKAPTLLGYIVGGIMSTLPNTNTMNDSAASPYIFEVHLTPKL